MKYCIMNPLQSHSRCVLTCCRSRVTCAEEIAYLVDKEGPKVYAGTPMSHEFFLLRVIPKAAATSITWQMVAATPNPPDAAAKEQGGGGVHPAVVTASCCLTGSSCCHINSAKFYRQHIDHVCSGAKNDVLPALAKLTSEQGKEIRAAALGALEVVYAYEADGEPQDSPDGWLV